MMTADPDLIADTVLTKFRDLPKRFKPRSDGTKEWVPIAGIVLRKGMCSFSTGRIANTEDLRALWRKVSQAIESSDETLCI